MNTELVLELERKVRDGFYDYTPTDRDSILTIMQGDNKLDSQFKLDLFTAFNLPYEDKEAVLLYNMASLIYDMFKEHINIGIKQYTFLFFRLGYITYLIPIGTDLTTDYLTETYP